MKMFQLPKAINVDGEHGSSIVWMHLLYIEYLIFKNRENIFLLMNAHSNADFFCVCSNAVIIMPIISATRNET